MLTASCLRTARRQFSLSARKLNINKQLDELAALKLQGSKVPTVDSVKAEKSRLVDAFGQYEPQVLTTEEVLPGSSRPLPINAELNYYAPLKHEVKHGHLKAEIVFKAFEPANLEFIADFALRVAYYLGLPATGPLPLRKRTERWTVIKSPFVHAKTKENFERHTHGRKIKIWDADNEVIDIMLSVLQKHSMWGVGMKCNMYVQEPLGMGKAMQKLSDNAKQVSDLSSTLDTLHEESDSPVAQKVVELLKDPLFAQHLTSEQLEQVQQKASNSD
ncbi:hypothetical protein OGAPHI_007104 [Ogataea philodendri]|uniref:Small ribosomal subunit protein uS10m n=1 Tax=Ogataea philodendri TaxID=1378263 RepID=A0A9P8NUD2_9ASCO|nr:uncharacterized protein OGAPHI_007104 [Ogataea philodendri]KAH3660518.1 hypothetical protein OGAPHI_007104 [Ogataea philodendri]